MTIYNWLCLLGIPGAVATKEELSNLNKLRKIEEAKKSEPTTAEKMAFKKKFEDYQKAEATKIMMQQALINKQAEEKLAKEKALKEEQLRKDERNLRE